MAGGRPTEYTEDIVALTEEYLKLCEDTWPRRTRKNPIPYSSLTMNVKLPTIEGLAVHLEVSRDTIYEWEGVYQEFSDILGKLRAMQADRLINSGLSGAYNPTIAKVLLTKHGYREGIEQTGKDGAVLFNEATKEKANSAIDELAKGDAQSGE